MHSHPAFKTNLFQRSLDKVNIKFIQTLVTDFFGGVQSVQLTESGYSLNRNLSVELADPFERIEVTVEQDDVHFVTRRSSSELIEIKFLVAVFISVMFVGALLVAK